MIETVIKRAIGVAIFASILVVAVPWLFDGSGDVLIAEPAKIESIQDGTIQNVSEVIGRASHKREQLLKEQQQSVLLHGQPADVQKIEKQPIPVPTPQKQQNPVVVTPPKSPEAEKPVKPKQTKQKTIAEELTDAQLQPPANTNTPQEPTTPKAPPTPKPKPEASPDKPLDTLDTFIQLHQKKWVVQLGLFSSQNNAKNLQKRLKNTQGDKVFMRKVTVKNGNYNGVFLGPYAKKQEAENAQEHAFNSLNIKGYVRSFSGIAWQQ